MRRRSTIPQRPVMAIVGGAKVSTKLDLLGNLVEEGRRARHRRRHGQHLPRRAGRRCRQVALREGPRRHRPRDRGEGQGRRLRDHAAGRCAGRTRVQGPSRPPRRAGRRGRGRRHDPRRRPAQRRRGRAASSTTVKTLVWNGPFGAFELPPFDTATVAVAKAAASASRPASSSPSPAAATPSPR